MNRPDTHRSQKRRRTSRPTDKPAPRPGDTITPNAGGCGPCRVEAYDSQRGLLLVTDTDGVQFVMRSYRLGRSWTLVQGLSSRRSSPGFAQVRVNDRHRRAA